MLDPSKVCVLNETEAGDVDVLVNSLQPVELSKSLHKKILRLKGTHLLDDGSKVNYAELRLNTLFAQFEEEARLLRLIELAQLNETEQKAFFLNVYNTLTVHALALLVKDEITVLELDKFWQRNAYRIGQFIFSLDDIEHGVLRGNKLHPTHKEYFFKEGDPRRAFVHTNLDPRIHFALNCGAHSCPPIRLFSADNIDNALDLATRAFCQSDIAIDVQTKRVKMTKILMWYGGDFGADEKSILRWVLDYLNDEQSEALKSIMNENPTLEYSDYNWNIS